MNNLINWELITITAADILDVVIIAFAIYKITMWIKGTKAMILFKGIAIILAVGGLSAFLQLTTIWWLFSNFFNIGILAMVIIFQPELRRVLEEIGRGKFAPHFTEDSEENENIAQTTDEILEAVQALSRLGHGALIIVVKDNSLAEVEATGVKIGGLVSSHLLTNIFEPNAPLHDGAVIIRDNRILAASCILPLTEEDIGKELGTRHRAAVGLSENYTALAIVVSEETGKISVATKGNLDIGIKPENLRRLLMGKRRPKGKKKLVLWRGGK